MSENLKTGTSLGGGELTAALKELLHLYENLCAEMEALAADDKTADHAARGEDVKKRFAELPKLPEEFSELLEKRFAEACKALDRAIEADAARLEAAAKLRRELQAVRDAGEFATLHEVEALKKRWNDLRGADGDAEWTGLIGEVETRLRAEEAEKIRRSEAAEKLAAEFDALVAADDPEALKNRRGGIEAEYAALGQVPSPAAARYKEAHRKAQTLLARHFETLDYARWESYTLKLDLLKELEQLQEAPENTLGNVSKRLVEIRDKWKLLGSVPHEKAEEVNPRYLELTRTLQHRVDEYFSNRRQEQKNAVEEKLKLCAEAEANMERTDWGPASGAFRELQAKWKQLPRAGNRESELFARFHAAADKFFTARNAVFAERDRKFAGAAAAKRKLIEEIPTLTDIRRAKNLRSEYNAIGSAGREENDLYKAFNAALDKFFADRNAKFAEKENEAAALVKELESLADAPLANGERVREIRRRFDELRCRKLAAAMEQAESRFDKALRDAEKSAAAERWTLYADAIRSAARLLDNTDAIPENVAAFPKLAASVELARQAASGDEKAAAQWKKHLAAAEKECARLLAEAEKLAGKNAEAAPVDLAAELQAAIMGNFARKEAESRQVKSTPQTLRKEFMALGALPAAQVEPVLELLVKL